MSSRQALKPVPQIQSEAVSIDTVDTSDLLDLWQFLQTKNDHQNESAHGHRLMQALHNHWDRLHLDEVFDCFASIYLDVTRDRHPNSYYHNAVRTFLSDYGFRPHSQTEKLAILARIDEHPFAPTAPERRPALPKLGAPALVPA